ncbi:AAA family ATPase [Duganella sp. S19_KUP01_CR8]|uniref:AAA family ATPase n=1 Tax=Duganella sp. S19_KUP01_CR8 TaxID=3025502 RepID=UPI002FCDDDB9
MSIFLYKLVVTGPDKETASLEFDGLAHLVYGPTDTGKSYIVQCLRYVLGSEEQPHDIGYSRGYTRVALQLEIADGTKYTFFKDLQNSEDFVYVGFHDLPPQDSVPLKIGGEANLINWSGATGRKILAKSGTLGNMTANDLRYVSIFDEIETLDKVSLEGKDRLSKTRNKSSISLILSGVDDSNIVLVASADKINIAKGHVESIEEQINSLKSEMPFQLTKIDADTSLARAEAQIVELNTYFKTNSDEIKVLKEERSTLDLHVREQVEAISALREAKNRFHLLDKKYSNDLERLQTISTAVAVVGYFETRPCPLCQTDVEHQLRHTDDSERHQTLRRASEAEALKIVGLRTGLSHAIDDIERDISYSERVLELAQQEERVNLAAQAELLAPKEFGNEFSLEALSERKAILKAAVKDFEKIDALEIRLANMKVKAKRKKQIVERDLAKTSTELCGKIKLLLDLWGVPGVESISFDESLMDILINQRKRISFGKGKRGIFLTAYVVSLMELALTNGHPHLGIVIIDSPVVTYKDPKHGNAGPDEVLQVIVKDKFYSWLADRDAVGQVIVLENEAPEDNLVGRLASTEFVGIGKAEGRKGFFPISSYSASFVPDDEG